MILAQAIDTINFVVSEIVETGVAIHETTGGGQIINGVDNSIVSSLFTLIFAAIVRHFEKKKLKKKSEKQNND